MLDLPECFGIEAAIEDTVMEQNKRLKPPFSIVLESNNEKSNQHYPQNNTSSFTTILPRRIEFSRKWIVTLKAFHKIYTILPLNTNTISGKPCQLPLTNV